MILGTYRTLTALGAPLISAYLERRARHGKEDPARLGERHGIAGRERPPGKLVWLHAASVGEAISLLPVIERVQSRYQANVLLTTGTVTSARLMGERLEGGAIHQYAPFDRAAWVRRFLAHWRPNLALICESELWPNLILETSRRTKLVLLNGRMSRRSYERWKRFPMTSGRLMTRFSLTLAQSDADAARFVALGAAPVASLGNLKFATPPLPASDQTLATLDEELGQRPRWLAASTHPGDEALAGRVHKALAKRFPGLVTVIVPRHPQRGVEIAGQLSVEGLMVARRAGGGHVSPSTDILLADTLGELGAFYRKVPVVLIGKSLPINGVGGIGGQNPLEPARLSCSVLFGPRMDNFAAVASGMLAAGAAQQVSDEAALIQALATRLADPALVADRGGVARDFADAQAGVLDRVMFALAPFLSS